MDLGTAPAVSAALHQAVDHSIRLPDRAGGGADGRRLCGWQARRYGWEVPPAWITRSPAASLAGLQAAIEHFCRSRRRAAHPYMPFRAVPGLLGRELIEVPMVDATRADDLRPRRHPWALGAGAGLVVRQPAQPLGRVFTVEEQLALAGVVDRHGARVFSDEIHARWCIRAPCTALRLPVRRHGPPCADGDSASKAWSLPGLKAAQLVLSDDADVAHWARVGFCQHGARRLHAGVLLAAASRPRAASGWTAS